MITDFPPELAAIINEGLPRNQKMWWVRGTVLSVEQVERPTDANESGRLRDLLVQVADVDTPGDGYDFRIQGTRHSVEINDPVSLIGHEPIDAERISFPRLYLNHNTRQYARIYPDVSQLDYGVLPLIDHKNWLATKMPANPAEKLKNFWGLALLLAAPYIVVGGIFGPLYAVLALVLILLLLSPWLIMGWLLIRYMRYLTEQPRFPSEEKSPPPLWMYNIREYIGFNRRDLTPFYYKMMQALMRWVPLHPAPEKEFVPIERGSHTVGALPVSTPAPAAVSAPTMPQKLVV